MRASRTALGNLQFCCPGPRGLALSSAGAGCWESPCPPRSIGIDGLIGRSDRQHLGLGDLLNIPDSSPIWYEKSQPRPIRRIRWGCLRAAARVWNQRAAEQDAAPKYW